MVRKSTVKLFLALVLVLLLAALVVAVAREALVASNVSNVASFHELQGIQGADTTSNVTQKKKAQKAGKSAEAIELDTIHGQKVAHFQTISAAQNTQNEYYGANERGLDASVLRSELERRIPEARGALAELKTLTDREVTLLKAIGGDETAIFVAESFYKAMETTVNTLQLDDLTEQQLEARERNIRIGGDSALATAQQMARRLEPDQLEEEEKTTLDEEVLKPGEAATKGLGDVLSNMPQIIWAAIQGLSESTQLLDRALNAYQGQDSMERMMHDLTYGQGVFNRRNMNAHQKRMDAIGSGVHQFLGTYSRFLNTVGDSIGRDVTLDPMGYGEDIIIRFADSRGRLYIVQEDDHTRVLVDKLMTQWDSDEHEVRTMIIYEYDDEAVETVVEQISEFAPGFEQYIRDSRILYIYRGYRPGIMRSFLYEINFQNSEGQERYHYSTQDVPKGQSIRRSEWDTKILETILAMNPPKKNTYSMRRPDRPRPSQRSEPGLESRREREDRREQRPEPQKTEEPGAAQSSTEQAVPQQQTAQAPVTPSQPAPAAPGAFSNDSENTANLSTDSKVINFYPLSSGEKNTLGIQHRAAYGFYSRRNYKKAYEEFSKLADQYSCNYLSAYWAGESAMRLRKRDDAKTWYDRALSINPNYKPAADARAELK